MDVDNAVPTPVLVLDPEALRRNLERMQALCADAGLALRPHAKGHRSPWIAARQIELGAVGVAAATAGEAAGLVRAGIPDVLITSALGPANAREAAGLARLARVAVVAGDVRSVAILAEIAMPLRVLVDVDVGQRRGGAPDAEAALAVAEAIDDAPTLELAGLQAYEGHVQGIADPAERRAVHAAAMGQLEAVLSRLADAGWTPAWVTGGGTASTPLVAATGLYTEVQPGSYALMDAAYARVSELPFEQAVGLVTTVIGVPGPGEVIVDAGHRAITTDMGPPLVAGLDATWTSAGDEHGRLTGDVDRLEPGDRVLLIPSHADTTVPLHPAFVLAPHGSLPLLGRG